MSERIRRTEEEAERTKKIMEEYLKVSKEAFGIIKAKIKEALRPGVWTMYFEELRGIELLPEGVKIKIHVIRAGIGENAKDDPYYKKEVLPRLLALCATTLQVKKKYVQIELV